MILADEALAADIEDKLLGSPQKDAVHSSLDLTSNGKSPAPQSTMNELNLSMLLPVPQSHAADKLKPIIEFLGSESEGKIVKNATLLGENLPIPKDARPAVSTMDRSTQQSQDDIAPSTLAKQKGISSSSRLRFGASASNANAAGVSDNAMQKSFPVHNQQTLISPSTENSASSLIPTNQNTVATNPKEMSSNLPALGNTEELVKNFLASKFGQALSKSLLNSGSFQDSSYKNLMAQHFGSNTMPTTAPATPISPNKGLIANLFSGLMQGSTGNSNLNQKAKDQSSKGLAQEVKQGSGVTNNFSSPTISIGNNVFSLDALSNALNNDNGYGKHTQNKSQNENKIIGIMNNSRKHPVKHKNKDKIRHLNEKIATLETLSDALDALTAKLSPDEKTKSDQKYESISLGLEDTIVQGRINKKHHTHHRHHKKKKNQFDEDIEMLGALLSRADTHSRSMKKPRYNSKDPNVSNYIVGINGKKSLNSADLEVLQSKINKAIEMAETMGLKQDAKSTFPSTQLKSTWLPLLVAGKVIPEEAAHTREEVATIHSSPQGSHFPKDSKVHSLQEILTRLIDNALRKGTLNELVQNWNRSGSPFAGIAKNISVFLQSNGGLKTPLTKGVNKTAFPTSLVRKPGASVKSNLTSQLLNGISGFDSTSPTDNSLFTKAVTNILGVLAKRQGFHNSNSTNQSLFMSTDTLKDFKGVLLGGRINKLVPQEDSIAGLGSKIVAEILKAHVNKSDKTNSTKQENITIKNKTRGNSDIKIDLLQGPGNQAVPKPFQENHVKEKLTFSSYDTKNVSRSIRNTTLMDFMNSMSGTGGQIPLPKSNKSGDKYSQVKPHLKDLMSVITASLLDMKDADNDSSSNNKKATKVRYDESGGKERLLHALPNDHKLSDYSKADAVLEAPNDKHAGKGNSSTKGPDQLLNSTSSNHTLPQFKANDLNIKTPKDKEIQDLDLGDQTVTLTLETIDDTPGLSSHTNEEPTDQTGLRSNKVPHFLNIQSATTQGKINSTFSKNMEHSFQQGEMPDVLSEFKAQTKRPDVPLPSEGSPGIGEDSQTKAIPSLPLGLQMNAIGRIADTDDHASVSPADLSAALTSDSDYSKGAEAKSFEDKILPVASDLTSTNGAKIGGETEAIVSKAASPATVGTALRASPERELPTASEVREMASSIKALLKVLNSYSKKLKLEDDEDDSQTGLLPTRSWTADRVTLGEKKAKEEDRKINQTPNLPFVDDSNVMKDTLQHKLQQEESLNSLMKPSKTTLTARKYNSNNPYVNFPQSSPELLSYVDSGGFENIQEQPSTDPTNRYNWNLGSEQAHAQRPLDANPTKSSLQPQLGADQWSPGNEVSRVTEELKDLNLPSIEDDPTVRAVQKMVANENMFANEKRKAIQKHEQQVSGANTHLPRKLGIFGRNTIPKNKAKVRNTNKSLVDEEKKVANSGKRDNNGKLNGRERDRNKIPHVEKNNNLSHPQKVTVRNSKPFIKGNTTQYSTRQQQSHSQRKIGDDGRSSRHNIPGSRNHTSLNESVTVLTHKTTIVKTKTSLMKGLQSGPSNATSKEAVKLVKINNQTMSGGRSQGALTNTKATFKTRKVNPLKARKTNYLMHPKYDTKNNGTA